MGKYLSGIHPSLRTKPLHLPPHVPPVHGVPLACHKDAPLLYPSVTAVFLQKQNKGAGKNDHTRLSLALHGNSASPQRLHCYKGQLADSYSRSTYGLENMAQAKGIFGK